MELFEFASQIATPDYVAKKIASCELAISGFQMAVAIELSVIVVCAIAALVSWRKGKRGGEAIWNMVYFTAISVASLTAIAMFSTLSFIGYGYQTLAAWSNDPVTEVVTRLASEL